jgi:hypothetical protein
MNQTFIEMQEDTDLEYRINAIAMRLGTAPTPDERRVAWSELCRLHALRSPETVSKMEGDRGLS